MAEGSPVSLMLPKGLTEREPLADAVAPKPELEASRGVDALGEKFLELLVSASDRSHSARHMAEAIAEGRSDDIHGTMIEVSKASIETRLLVNAKNKITDAFYELWRMNI